jgi:hypothetical protein
VRFITEINSSADLYEIYTAALSQINTCHDKNHFLKVENSFTSFDLISIN